MRPWYYINSLRVPKLNDTSRITESVLGEGSDEHFCSNIYDNPKLFLPSPYRKSKRDYIYTQDFIWLLSIIAPRLRHQH